MSNRTLILAAALLSGVASAFGQGPALGLNFAATDPDADTSSLSPEEIAGVVPHANWNNLAGPTGTNVGSLFFDQNGTAVASTATVTWTSPNTWRSGGNNALPDGPDRKLLSGYIDTGDTTATGISLSVTNIDAAIVAGGYDVYIYFAGDSTANRGGAYTINPGSGPVVKWGSTMPTAPTEFVEDPGTDQDISLDGNYLKFVGLTGNAFTLTTDASLTTPNGVRAPINAIQIVPNVPFGPDITGQPVPVTVYSGRTARFTAAATGFPPVSALRWQKDGVDLVESARITGVTNNVLSISDATTADVGAYRLVATSSRGTTNSAAAQLAIAATDGSDYETSLLLAGPLGLWRLNEQEGTNLAYDFVGGRTGSYEDGVTHGAGAAGPQPTEFPGFATTNTAAQFDGTAWVTVPTPALNTNAVTIISWIRPSATQLDYTGIFMTRSGTAAGVSYTTDNQLGYTWNNNTTWSWSSGLRPPDNQWSMVALVTQADRATLYLGSAGTLAAAINPIVHTAEAWGGDARIGDDQGGTGRTFNGLIDEVTVFNRALSYQEIAGLYEDATGIVQATPPSISPQPSSTTRYAGADVQLKTGVSGLNVGIQWQRNGINLTNDARISGVTTDTLVLNDVTAADAGSYTLVATNATGTTTSDPATVTVLASPNAYVSDITALNPAAYYRLNDEGDPASGTLPAVDLWGGLDGTWGAASQMAEGPRPSSGYGTFEADNSAVLGTAATADSWVTVPGPGFATNTVTFLAWINPNTLVANGGIVFARAGQPATGMNLGGAGGLGYHWLDTAGSYNFVSGLIPPVNQWSLVAVVVEPTIATLHLINSSGARSVINTNAHAVRTFSDNIRIAGEPSDNARTFDGQVDEVAIFSTALTATQLQGLYQGALGIIAPVIVGQPVARTEYPGSGASFTVAASGTAPLAYQWQKGSGSSFVNITDSATVSGATNATLVLSNLAAADGVDYRVVVTNPQGSATSDAAHLTILAVPPAPAEGSFGHAILESGANSYYRLNETGDPAPGTLQAYDHAGNRHGLYGVAVLNGSADVAGPRPADGFTQFEASNTAVAMLINTANSWVTVPGPGFTTDQLTILAWINPSSLLANSGIVFARAGQPATGLNLNGTGNLGYHWLDSAATYNWDSLITPPVSQWSLVALVVEPTRATVHLINSSGTQSAVNTNAHAARPFTDDIRIGGDPNAVGRNFDGVVDEVAIYDTALTIEQIESIYAGEVPITGAELTITTSNDQITISWDGAGTLQSTPALLGTATVWANETTTGSSLTVTPTGSARFYRLMR